jgi:hypothetical protein
MTKKRLLLTAGRYREFPKVCCSRQEGSGSSRKAAAYGRKVPGVPESLLLTAGRFREFPKGCCLRQEGSGSSRKAAAHGRKVPGVPERLLLTAGRFRETTRRQNDKVKFNGCHFYI